MKPTEEEVLTVICKTIARIDNSEYPLSGTGEIINLDFELVGYYDLGELVALIIDLEKKFNISIDDNETWAWITVKDIFNSCYKRL